MKSLVFNLMVVAALAVLLFDGKPPESLRDEAFLLTNRRCRKQTWRAISKLD